MALSRDRLGTMGMALLFEGGVGLLAILLAWGLEIPLASRMSIDVYQVLWGLAATGPMLAAYRGILQSRRKSLKQLQRLVEWLSRELFPTGALVPIAIVSALAGFGEEALFRGVLQPIVDRWTLSWDLGPWVGLLVVSLLFGLAHSLSRLYFLLATLIGLYFGILAIIFDSVTIPAVAHAIYDFIVLAYMTREYRQKSSV